MELKELCKAQTEKNWTVEIKSQAQSDQAQQVAHVGETLGFSVGREWFISRNASIELDADATREHTEMKMGSVSVKKLAVSFPNIWNFQ